MEKEPSKLERLRLLQQLDGIAGYNEYDREPMPEIRYPYFLPWWDEDKNGNEIELMFKINGVGGGGEDCGPDWYLDIMKVGWWQKLMYKFDKHYFKPNIDEAGLEELTGEDIIMMGVDECLTLDFIPFYEKYPYNRNTHEADIRCHINAWQINRDNGYVEDCIRHYPCEGCNEEKQRHDIFVTKEEYEWPYEIAWIRCRKCGSERIAIANAFLDVGEYPDSEKMSWERLKQVYVQYKKKPE